MSSIGHTVGQPFLAQATRSCPSLVPTAGSQGNLNPSASLCGNADMEAAKAGVKTSFRGHCQWPTLLLIQGSRLICGSARGTFGMYGDLNRVGSSTTIRVSFITPTSTGALWTAPMMPQWLPSTGQRHTICGGYLLTAWRRLLIQHRGMIFMEDQVCSSHLTEQWP